VKRIHRRDFLKNALPACVAISARRGLSQTDGCAGIRSPEHLFPSFKAVSLRDLRLSDAAQLAVDTTGYIYVIARNPESAVRQYDPTGRLVRRFGGYGRADGQFVTPISICCDSARKLYTLDVALGRIQMFGQNGICEHSISMLSQGLQPSQVACRTPGSLYVASSPQAAKSPLIHRIDLNGRVLSSFIPTEERVATLNLWAIATGLVALGEEGSVYAGQRVTPIIGKFSPQGAHLLDIGTRPPCWVEPTNLPQPYPKDPASLDYILQRFTRLDNILLFRGNAVALSYRLAGESPRWLVQLYGPQGQPKGEPVQFDMRPAATDFNKTLYCRAAPSSIDRGANLDLRIYSMASGSQAL
jgi:hypothetical protein